MEAYQHFEEHVDYLKQEVDSYKLSMRELKMDVEWNESISINPDITIIIAQSNN